MASQLTKSFSRLWSIEAGIVMVVTDLHGDWDVYQRYRDHFIDLKARGTADYLIFTGDLIHAEDPGTVDCSLEIVLDVMRLQAEYGPAVIYLCGNHELPHIYGFGLSKGTIEFTPDFEARLSESGKREEIIGFFQSLPFFIRTRGGVSLTHAGASTEISDAKRAFKLFNWDHKQKLTEAEAILNSKDVPSLQRAYAKLSGAESYEELASHYLAVTGPTDPRYNDLLRGVFVGLDPDYDLLYVTLFTRCEHEYGVVEYALALEKLLAYLSTDYGRQNVLVTGHIAVENGCQIVSESHLRLTSRYHSGANAKGVCLLFDATQTIDDATELARRVAPYSIIGR